MLKSQKRSIGVLILLMLFSSTLSVNYSFAESDEIQEENKLENSENIRKDRLWTILTEKVVNGKLEVQRYALPTDLSEEDIHRELSFDGKTAGWAYVNYKAYHSGIVLFDGKASKVGENLWKISSNNNLNFRESQFDLEFHGKFNDSDKEIQETALDEELSFKIIFTGKLAETNQEDVLYLSFTILGLKNTTMLQNGNYLPTGIISDISEKGIESNQGFGNSGLNSLHYFL